MAEVVIDPSTVQGVKYLQRIFQLLERLASAGCERDAAGNRRLLYSRYAGLVLLSMFNPILQTLQGLSAVSDLKKIQRVLGGGRVSTGSLSESVRVFDPALLKPLIAELFEALPQRTARSMPGSLPHELVQRLTAVDGSALRTLPQLVWANRGHGQWRMHLQFEVWRGLPQQMTLTEDEVGGDADERSVLATQLQAGRVYIVDRGYERYALFQQIVAAKSDYVCRVQRRNSTVLETRALSDADRAAGVVSDEIIQTGATHGTLTHPVRRVVIAGGVPQQPGHKGRERSEEIVLLTNLVDPPAAVIADVYRLRWSIELFFRFFKHVLGCQHLLSDKPEGIAIQIYCALIAALLIALTTGGNLGRHGFQLVCLYLQGWADEDELAAGIARLMKRTPAVG